VALFRRPAQRVPGLVPEAHRVGPANATFREV